MVHQFFSAFYLYHDAVVLDTASGSFDVQSGTLHWHGIWDFK